MPRAGAPRTSQLRFARGATGPGITERVECRETHRQVHVAGRALRQRPHPRAQPCYSCVPHQHRSVRKRPSRVVFGNGVSIGEVEHGEPSDLRVVVHAGRLATCRRQCTHRDKSARRQPAHTPIEKILRGHLASDRSGMAIEQGLEQGHQRRHFSGGYRQRAPPPAQRLRGTRHAHRDHRACRTVPRTRPCRCQTLDDPPDGGRVPQRQAANRLGQACRDKRILLSRQAPRRARRAQRAAPRPRRSRCGPRQRRPRGGRRWTGGPEQRRPAAGTPRAACDQWREGPGPAPLHRQRPTPDPRARGVSRSSRARRRPAAAPCARRQGTRSSPAAARPPPPRRQRRRARPAPGRYEGRETRSCRSSAAMPYCAEYSSIWVARSSG